MAKKSRKTQPRVVATKAKPAVQATLTADDQSEELYWVCHPVDLAMSSSGDDDALDEFRVKSFDTIDGALPYLLKLQEKSTPFFCVFGRRVQLELSKSVRVTAGSTVLNVPVPSQEGRNNGQTRSEEDHPEEGRQGGAEEGPQGPGAEVLDE